MDDRALALALVEKWLRREVAWDTPRARDLATLSAILRNEWYSETTEE